MQLFLSVKPFDCLIIIYILCRDCLINKQGRLPLHDKSISDALEIGIADCLRSLQRSSPGLLLTAQQLKGIERDVKYIPAATCAITSILCRSTRSTVYDNAMNIMSSWDDQVKRMRMKYGVELGAASRTVQSHARDEDLRFDALRSILERRLRFIVSDEFKDAKKTSEKEQQKRDREGSAAAKKMINAIHGMKSDCFDSDDSDHSTLAESARHERQLHSTRYHSRSSIRFQHSRRRQNGAPLSPTSSVTVAAGLEQILYAESHHGHQISSRNDRSGTGAKSNQPSCKNFNECVSSELRLTGSPVNNFDDGYESSPKLPSTLLKSWPITQCPSRFACDASADGFQREERRLTSHCQSKSQVHDDAMSSDSDWSSQYGEVVAGHIFR